MWSEEREMLENERSYRRERLEKDLSLCNQWLQSRGVLTRAVPASRTVTQAVGGISHPAFRLHVHVLHFEDTTFVVFGRESQRVSRFAQGDIGLQSELSEFVQEGLLHHRSRDASLIESEHAASRVAWANVWINRVADASHVW